MQPAHADSILTRDIEPLAAPVRTSFEARLGHDFGHVRVHRDGGASESAKAFGAGA
jgi:hypothetical protein